MELNKGLITTLLSDAGLVISTYLTGQTLTTDITTQAIITGLALLLAALDIKYPRYMTKFREALDALTEADTLATTPDEEPQ